MRDVVIVGAGLAGLTAAKHLRERGLDIEVIEARSRVAGRTEGGFLDDGTPVELGGQWVGPSQDAVLELVDELGLTTFQVYDSGDSLLIVDGQHWTGPEETFGIPEASLGEFRRILTAIDELSATVDLAAPWNTPEAGPLDHQTADAWLRTLTEDDVVLRFYQVMMVTLFAAETSEMSLLHFLFYMKSGGGPARLMATIGGAQDSRVEGGTHQICERLAERIGDRLRLNTPVHTIRQHDDHVAVRYTDGGVDARHVIVTLPPTLAGRLTYDPAMPPHRDSLTQQIPAGTVIKYQIGYDRPFWRNNGQSGGVLSLDHPVSLVFDNCPPSGNPGVLVAFIEGDHARAAQNLSPQERRRLVLDNLVTYFGEQAAQPFDLAERNWSTEPYTRGCYGGRLGTGVWTTLGPALSQPVGRIHWACSETASIWNGYMDGAIRAGRRAADELTKNTSTR
jgi:monoamine oxidase